MIDPGEDGGALLPRCRGAPRLRRGVSERGGFGGPFEAPHELVKLIGALAADEAVRVLRQAGLAASVVNSVADLVREPHLWSRGDLVRRADPGTGEIVTQGVVPLLSRTPGRLGDWSRRPGSDNDAVLGALLGYSPQRIREIASPSSSAPAP